LSDCGDQQIKSFLDLMNVCAYRGYFAQIYTRKKDSLNFEANYIDFGFHSDETNDLENCAKPNTWNLIPNLGGDGTYLLLPPENLAATCISDFCRKYKVKRNWNEICIELFYAIKKSLNSLKNDNPTSTYWVYTSGLREPYLHIRFEPFKTRKYL